MNSGIRYWIPLAVTITALCGLIYLSGQQNLRMGANDPQIQMSEDIATRLSINPTLPNLTSSNKIDISKSLSPFIIIYNDKNKPVLSTAQLDGNTPLLPPGVLANASNNRQNRVTWEPKKGVRSAAVITRYSGSKGSGYVLVGRSLREVEIREDTLLKIVGLAWIVTLIASLIAKVIFIPKQKKNPSTKLRTKK